MNKIISIILLNTFPYLAREKHSERAHFGMGKKYILLKKKERKKSRAH